MWCLISVVRNKPLVPKPENMLLCIMIMYDGWLKKRNVVGVAVGCVCVYMYIYIYMCTFTGTCTQQIGFHEAPLCVLLVLEIL